MTEAERMSFINALSDFAAGSDGTALRNSLEELSYVCRRNRTVQDIVQNALRPLDLNLNAVSWTLQNRRPFVSHRWWGWGFCGEVSEKLLCMHSSSLGGVSVIVQYLCFISSLVGSVNNFQVVLYMFISIILQSPLILILFGCVGYILFNSVLMLNLEIFHIKVFFCKLNPIWHLSPTL